MSGSVPNPVASAPFAAWWLDRYGGPGDLFDRYRFFQRGRGNVWLASADSGLQGLSRVDGIGIPFARVDAMVWKPTTIAVIHLGHTATRNTVEVSADEARELLQRRTLTLDASDARRQLASRGYVIARWLGVPLGCAFWREGVIESLVPKGRVMPVLDLPWLAEDLPTVSGSGDVTDGDG